LLLSQIKSIPLTFRSTTTLTSLCARMFVPARITSLLRGKLSTKLTSTHVTALKLLAPTQPTPKATIAFSGSTQPPRQMLLLTLPSRSATTICRALLLPEPRTCPTLRRLTLVSRS
jgi:hypothetical protein